MSAARRLAAALRQDVRLQWRYGFWLAYALVSAGYVVGLGLLPSAWIERATVLVVFSDPAVLGFFFVGGLMLLERGEHTLRGCFASPLRIEEWLLSKALSLTLLASVASLAVALPLSGSVVRPGLLLAAVVPTSLCFVLLGIAVGTRSSTVNRYLLGGGLSCLPLMIPLLAPLGIADSWAFDLLPSGASLDLLDAALGITQLAPGALLVRELVLLVWIVGMFAWARAWMHRHVLGGEG